MSKDKMIPVEPGNITSGQISFTLYSSDKENGTVLFAKEGLELTGMHIQKLRESGRLFYIKHSDSSSYLEYSLVNFQKLFKGKRMEVSTKTKLLHDISFHTARKLFNSPENREFHADLSTVVDGHISMLNEYPESAGDLLMLSDMDSYSYSHSINVGVLNILISQQLLGEDHEDVKKYGLAGSLHDIGKILCNQDILMKRGEISHSDYEHLKKHCLFSQRILIGQQYPRCVMDAAMNHHERIDGHGYPHGLRSKEIPLIAKVTAASDVYDALTSKKVYSTERTHLEALEIMASDIGHFDLEIFDALLKVVIRDENLINRYMNKSAASRGK
jgi:HD-GYP domain-containing protein (c-di-GMP phosphodiesterase class II)